MIPILFESTETEFNHNGLGRIRDAIEVKVVEERNGVYECDFSIPVTSEDFKDILIGRIIGVTHDETGDIQPFDIVSFTRPIDGVVTFHCTHISYRLSYYTVITQNVVNLSQALTALKFGSNPDNPFTFNTDKNSSGYLPTGNGVPISARQMMGGVEGSILDTYGGEYEFDKFNVILHESRGTLRNFTIRYGVNMLDYNEELDISGTYMACIPYWTDGTTIVKGAMQFANGSTITGRGECIPLDVSDKFESSESIPTKAQVEAMGRSVMSAANPTIPSQNIHVEFVRLQDMGYEGLENLLQCGLCDTIKVVFPFYNTTGQFKIVKTVWDVLADRYESMELGDLSVTLAEALGVSSESNKTSNMTDFVVAQDTDGIWTYRKWNSGIAECWGHQDIPSTAYAANGGYRAISAGLPSGLFTTTPDVVNASGRITGNIQTMMGFTSPNDANSIQTYLINRSGSAVTQTGVVYWDVKGKWK